MNSAEFKMIRRLLGITPDEVAATFQVAVRSARRWETTHKPPEAVAAWLNRKLSQAKTIVYDTLTRIEADTTTDPDHITTLPMYRTDEQARAALDPSMTKEQHAAIMGLITFLADDDLHITAEYITVDN